MLALAPPRGSVELDGPRWQQLSAHEEERAPPGPWVATRDIKLLREEEGLLIRGQWTLRTSRPGWFMGDLLGPGVEIRKATWNGRPAAIDRAGALTIVAGYVRDEVRLEVEAFIPGDPANEPLTLDLLPAVAGRMTLPATPEDQQIRVEDPTHPGEPPPRREDVVLSGASRLQLSQGRKDPANAQTLVTATSGVGLTIGDAELRGRALVTWTILRGSVNSLIVDAENLGDDLEINGPGIREWRRIGSRIEVLLQAPTRDRIALDFRWSQALSPSTESSLPLPRITPVEVFRGAHALQLARDGEIEVIPRLGEWAAVASADLPTWGRGLVEGTPTAAYTTTPKRDGTLSLLRFVPVESPPVVVDVAAITVATSREGRLLMRAHYEVRNERAAHLRVTPPPGMRILGAQVAGETSLPARDRDGAWLIPLRRSIETVKGALTFPVEVTLLGESDAWQRRERRKLTLPAVDAPIAVTRLTLYLPPGYTSKLGPGDGDVVDDFTRGEGITYGMGIGDVGIVQADAHFQGAVQSWLANDFAGAQAELDALHNLGASNENVDRLQANLDVIVGGKDKDKNQDSTGTGGADAAIERRIKEQAKARAAEDIRLQASSQQQAEEYSRSGEYELAEASYAQAIEIGERLAMLEQDESVEQRSFNAAIEASYASVKKTKARRADRQSKRSQRRGKREKKKRPIDGKENRYSDLQEDQEAFETSTSTTSYDFEDDTLEGELQGGQAATGSSDGTLYRFDDDLIDGELLAPESEPLVDAMPGVNGGSSTFTIDGVNAIDPVHGITESQAEDLPVEPISLDIAMDAPRKRLISSGRRRRRRENRRRSNAPAAPPTPPQASTSASIILPEDLRGPKEAPAKFKDMSNLGRLAAPIVQASAMSVVIPAAGEAVRYQRLLLPQGTSYDIDITAREPLLPRRQRHTKSQRR